RQRQPCVAGQSRDEGLGSWHARRIRSLNSKTVVRCSGEVCGALPAEPQTGALLPWLTGIVLHHPAPGEYPPVLGKYLAGALPSGLRDHGIGANSNGSSTNPITNRLHPESEVLGDIWKIGV